MIKDNLLIYRFSDAETILNNMCLLFEEGLDRSLAFETFHKLISWGSEMGFSGNLWHLYLTYLLVNCENAYSLATEKTGECDGSVVRAALLDMGIFAHFFAYDFEGLRKALDTDAINIVLDFRATGIKRSNYSPQIRESIEALARNAATAKASALLGLITSFYKDIGVGELGLHRAFRLKKDKNHRIIIDPINNIPQVLFYNLVGIERQEKALRDNTEAFLSGRSANNVLLYGDAGTGKSSSIKAICNEYFPHGLRVIEVYKNNMGDLSTLLGILKNRNYKFIVYMDDLSFEDFEVDYKYLKAIMEGGLEEKPDNVLIYATSNRRHIVNEKFSDRNDAVHASDTMQEKLSLSARFGLAIYYGSSDKEEFLHIVDRMAMEAGIEMDREELYSLAMKWEIRAGGMNGRCARQFIDSLKGMG